MENNMADSVVDSLLMSLIDKEIPDGRNTLLESHHNLADLSAYCKENYINSPDKAKALEETKNYASQSLASVAYQIHSLAVNILQMMDQQSIQLQQMQSNANNIGLLVDIHKEKVARREIGVLTSSKNFSRSHKIVPPAQQEKQQKYRREDIDFSALDHIGHGVKSERKEETTTRRFSTSSSSGSLKGNSTNSIHSSSQGSLQGVQNSVYQSGASDRKGQFGGTMLPPPRPPVAPVAPFKPKPVSAAPVAPAPVMPPPSPSAVKTPQHIPTPPQTPTSIMPPPPELLPEPDYDGKLNYKPYPLPTVSSDITKTISSIVPLIPTLHSNRQSVSIKIVTPLTAHTCAKTAPTIGSFLSTTLPGSLETDFETGFHKKMSGSNTPHIQRALFTTSFSAALPLITHNDHSPFNSLFKTLQSSPSPGIVERSHSNPTPHPVMPLSSPTSFSRPPPSLAELHHSSMISYAPFIPRASVFSSDPPNSPPIMPPPSTLSLPRDPLPPTEPYLLSMMPSLSVPPPTGPKPPSMMPSAPILPTEPHLSSRRLSPSAPPPPLPPPLPTGPKPTSIMPPFVSSPLGVPPPPTGPKPSIISPSFAPSFPKAPASLIEPFPSPMIPTQSASSTYIRKLQSHPYIPPTASLPVAGPHIPPIMPHTSPPPLPQTPKPNFTVSLPPPFSFLGNSSTHVKSVSFNESLPHPSPPTIIPPPPPDFSSTSEYAVPFKVADSSKVLGELPPPPPSLQASQFNEEAASSNFSKNSQPSNTLTHLQHPLTLPQFPSELEPAYPEYAVPYEPSEYYNSGGNSPQPTNHALLDSLPPPPTLSLQYPCHVEGDESVLPPPPPPPPPMEGMYQVPPNNTPAELSVDDLPPPPPENLYESIQSTDGFSDPALTNTMPPPPPPMVAPEGHIIPETYEEKVVAIYDYHKLRDDELELTEGDVIYVIKKNEDGWFEGLKDGIQGLFPGNYVTPYM